jgi:hypothetical protein
MIHPGAWRRHPASFRRLFFFLTLPSITAKRVKTQDKNGQIAGIRLSDIVRYSNLTILPQCVSICGRKDAQKKQRGVAVKKAWRRGPTLFHRQDPQ